MAKTASYELLSEHLQSSPWSFSSTELENRVSENLVSEHVLQLPQSVYQQAEQLIAQIFAQKRLQSPSVASDLTGLVSQTQNFGFSMSYDFHLDENQNLKLIEINTNASFMLMSALVYQSKQLAPPAGMSLDQIFLDLQTEWQLYQSKQARQTQPRVLICDDRPNEQKLFIEFLCYQKLFQSKGWPCEIRDSRDWSPEFSLVYNRDTDFFLARPEVQSLRRAWLTGQTCLTPNPIEYSSLADKQRLVEWSEQKLFAPYLPQCVRLTRERAEDIWSKRKKFFFKPLQSFGAKQSYRGENISKRLFDELVGKDILAQEYIPAPTVEIETPEGPQNMKYDLRVYAYQGQVRGAIARLYQGQVTNLKTKYGGFTAVQFRN